jgi:hypothetical protein
MQMNELLHGTGGLRPARWLDGMADSQTQPQIPRASKGGADA